MNLQSRIQELEEAEAIRRAKGIQDEQGESTQSIKTEHISQNQEA